MKVDRVSILRMESSDGKGIFSQGFSRGEHTPSKGFPAPHITAWEEFGHKSTRFGCQTACSFFHWFADIELLEELGAVMKVYSLPLGWVQAMEKQHFSESLLHKTTFEQCVFNINFANLVKEVHYGETKKEEQPVVVPLQSNDWKSFRYTG